MELEDEDRTPVGPVSVVNGRFNHCEVAARQYPTNARPSGDRSIHLTPALASNDALCRLGELDYRILVKPPVEPFEILIDERLKQPFHGLAVRRPNVGVVARRLVSAEGGGIVDQSAIMGERPGAR